VQPARDPLVPGWQIIVYSMSRGCDRNARGHGLFNRQLPVMMLPLRMIRRLAAVALAASTLVATVAIAQQPRPEGAWRFDPSRSDSLTTRFGRGSGPAGGPVPGPGGAGPGGEGPGGTGAPGYGPPGSAGPGGERGPGGDVGGSRRFGGGRFGSGMSEKDLARIRQTLELVRVVPVEVRISIADGTFTTIDSAGIEQTLRIGKTRVTPATDSAGAVKMTAHWKGDALIVEQKVDGGGKIVESYGVGLDGTRMIVFVELTIGLTPRSFTRQYVRAGESSTPH
jgi:hypothetical protein